MAILCITKPQPKITYKRDWRFYSKDLLHDHLSLVDWTNNASNVQEFRNDFEIKRWYKTGDLGSYDAVNGGVILIGRIDFQVNLVKVVYFPN